MILQDPSHPMRVLSELADLLLDPDVERLRVAVAYANPDGVRTLQALLAAADPSVRVEVVVTLDMGITRKAALEILLREFSGIVRVISSESGSGTFHAKAFVVDRGDAAQRALVGSANLTGAALTSNHEAVKVADLTPEESAAWETWWADLDAAADDLTQDVIETYEERRPPPGRRERIADSDEETRADGSSITHPDPEVGAHAARWLAIDWGGTGEYRVQAEFPRAAAAFFRPEEDSREITIRHDGSDYEDNQLAYYPNNGMARINLDGDIPVVADGSIRRETSLFTRLDSDYYELRLLTRTQRARRLAEAASAGGGDHTERHDGTLREFGWM